ncbi:hypothetical protein BD289DRAFT_108841 [Coniella lustricola]|uniref:SWIRM domain-containing protein n=1 Tax=Coniella lustricola TaxID=2025994 RepID=A0A2T2ZXH8_9PEZI|nr:hypothetical protein BD289DRAFT_108841 [Coniella lustricola]
MTMSSNNDSNPFFAAQAGSAKLHSVKQKCAIGNLISPPQQPLYDSFPEDTPPPELLTPSPTSKSLGPGRVRPIVPALVSPPVSPETPFEDAPVLTTDGPLLPSPELFTAARPGPLQAAFEHEARQTIDRHITATKKDPRLQGHRRPSRDEYTKVLFFQRVLATPQTRQAYLKELRDQLKADDAARRSVQQPQTHLARKPLQMSRPIKAKPPVAVAASSVLARPPTSSSSSSSNSIIVSHALAPQHNMKVAKPPVSRPRVPRPARPVKAAKPRSSTSPQPEKRKPAKADKDFASLPDYSPPLSTLTPTNVLGLKPAFLGNRREFDENDRKLAHLLHPNEQDLAADLRLDVATYLTSKRRIFIEKLHFLHDKKKDFRKTHAQVACRIDVNKASKLHTAFDEVGWLADKWFVNLPRPSVLNN